MGYCTTDDVRARLGGATLSDRLDLDLIIDAVSKRIDFETGRTFTTPTDSTKTFVVEYDGILVVPDLLSVSDITIKGSSTDSGRSLSVDEYRLWPNNGVPHTSITSDVFWVGMLVDVAGTWGNEYQQVVKDACVIWTIVLMKAADSAYSDYESAVSEVGQLAYKREIPTAIRPLLMRLKRVTV